MKKEQLVFFSQLQEIQEQIIASKDNFQEDEIENAYNLTYETIYKVLELIDGYTTDEIKLDLIDKLSGNSIKSNIQLHDQCALFLKSF
ncbi:hypothetical protein [Vagococcus fluvialis]|uniref:hypothetical protein n=1 Tax=Vagococcus fluvialis TaxID=2738 RepID=UPI00288E94B9|nr:hypothetical protein [Vagococcus fluvialis]MDT2745865.1 hypothetical protein [Vagococcus fluvialis]